jgi:hypothetical protein
MGALQMDSYAAPLIGKRLLACAAGAAALLLLSTAHAAPVAFYDPTDFDSFFGSLPKATLDFDNLTAGDLIPSGDVIPSGSPLIGGITFSYGIDGVKLAVIDTFETTSGRNSLGTTDGGVLLAGDGFSLAFDRPVTAVGMYFISSEDLFEDDITLTANGFTASLICRPPGSPICLEVTPPKVTPLRTLGDDGQVFFLGLGGFLDGLGRPVPFSSVTILTTACEGCFLYNVDDIVIAGAVPEPSTLWLLGAGLAGLGLLRRRSAKLIK